MGRDDFLTNLHIFLTPIQISALNSNFCLEARKCRPRAEILTSKTQFQASATKPNISDLIPIFLVHIILSYSHILTGPWGCCYLCHYHIPDTNYNYIGKTGAAYQLSFLRQINTYLLSALKQGQESRAGG